MMAQTVRTMSEKICRYPLVTKKITKNTARISLTSIISKKYILSPLESMRLSLTRKTQLLRPLVAAICSVSCWFVRGGFFCSLLFWLRLVTVTWIYLVFLKLRVIRVRLRSKIDAEKIRLNHPKEDFTRMNRRLAKAPCKKSIWKAKKRLK